MSEMKKNNFSFRPLIMFFGVTAFAVFGASGLFLTGAQQNQNVQRPRQTTATPPTTPLPRVTPPPSPSPTEEEVITVDNDNVILSVRVVDRNGRIVADVKPEEFKVFEDGVQQQIEDVSKADVPVNYGMVVDNSGSLRFQLEKIIEAGKILVAANKPEDASFVVRFVSSDKIEILQDFTKNKNDLNEALDNMFPDTGQTAIIDAVMLAAENAGKYEKNKRTEDKSRRALILITDGEDRDSYYKEEDLFKMLREADVQIYPIGFVSELTKEGGLIKDSPQKKAIKFLERLARETGGKPYFPKTLDEMPDIARAINAELRTQYSIAYAPSNDKRDGTFRTIKVQITDDPKRGRRIPVTKNGRTAPKN